MAPKGKQFVRMVVTYFFDSNNLFISVSSVQRIFRSSFVVKFILPRSQKYFSGILYTYFESICTANLSSLQVFGKSRKKSTKF